MQLGIIVADPLERFVLQRAAARRYWQTVCSQSVCIFSEFDCPDAIIVDAECIDETARRAMAMLRTMDRRRPVFVLAERLADVPPDLQSLCTVAIQLKPYHPIEFLDLVESAA